MVDTRISDQQLPTLRVQSGVTASDPTLASTLTPGAIVSVKIQREPGGQPGIVIDGKFVAATIPPQLEHDATVELLVVRNTPAILLRVVSLDPQPLQARPATLLDQAFRALLSGDDITGLKDAFRAVDRDIGQSLTTLTKSLDSAPSKNGSLKEVSLKLAHHLESLQVLDEPSLREPTTVMRSLEQALTRGIKPGEAALSSVNASIRSATAAIDELNRSLQEARQIPLALKTIETLRSEIAKLRGDPGGLSFGDLLPTLESGTEGSGALAVTSHSIAIAAGRSHAFTDVGRGRPPIDGEATPLVIFLRALGALLPELSREESPLHKELTLAVRQLRTEINRIAPGPQERAEIEAALSKAEQQLSALAREAAGRQSSATLLVTSADISKEIERVTEGQDILRFLAPLAQSVGEPIALFLPAVVHGLLTKFEFAFHPPPQAVDDESGDSAEEVDRFFERVDVTLPLPALGSVHVAVARRPSEVLINFTCSTSEADTFLKSLIPRLEELLEKLGYPKKLVASTVGEVPSALPTWCRTITRSNVVA